jgi:hypothetical protein
VFAPVSSYCLIVIGLARTFKHVVSLAWPGHHVRSLFDPFLIVIGLARTFNHVVSLAWPGHHCSLLFAPVRSHLDCHWLGQDFQSYGVIGLARTSLFAPVRSYYLIVIGLARTLIVWCHWHGQDIMFAPVRSYCLIVIGLARTFNCLVSLAWPGHHCSLLVHSLLDCHWHGQDFQSLFTPISLSLDISLFPSVTNNVIDRFTVQEKQLIIGLLETRETVDYWTIV